jgi:hypothetical protein
LHLAALTATMTRSSTAGRATQRQRLRSGANKAPPWTAEEDAILLQVRKQYDAGEYASHLAFTQAALDALGGKRTPIACFSRCNKLRPEPRPGIARPKRIKLDANAVMDCDDADGDEGGAAAVLHESNAPSWSPDEDSVLRRLVDRWHADKFASANSFYDEAVKQLVGRKAGAIRLRLRFLELTVPSYGTGGRGPLWSQSEDNTLMDICFQCKTGQFTSGEQLSNHLAERLPGRSANACCHQLRKLGHDIPQVLLQIINAALHAARAAAKRDEDGAAVALKINPPSWSQSEGDILIDICCQCNAGQFASGEKLLAHLAERLPWRSAYACYKQLRKLGHDIPQVLRQIVNAALHAAKAAANRDEHGAAVALKINPPLWSPEEDSVLKHLMSQWRKKQFASAQKFYDEAVKRLPGRSAVAIAGHLRRHHKMTNVPSTRFYKPADEENARTSLSVHAAAAAADVAAAVKDDISDDTPLAALPQATLPPPPLWMIRNSATGKTSRPLLISVLRRGVAEGRINAKDMLAWRQHEGESAAISLQTALDLPRIPSRSQQMTRARAR